MNQTAIRILVVDDHTLFRRGLTALLARDPGLLVVGDAGDAGEAQRKAQALQPQLILLDNHLPGVNGVNAIPGLLGVAPQARIVMLTVSEDQDDLAAALRAGASGYLLKTIEGDALSAAIRRVMEGHSVVDDEMTSKLIAAVRSSASPEPAIAFGAALPMGHGAHAASLASLSPRETDILRAIGGGASNKEIARALGIAESTVKIHVQHVLRKFEVGSRVQLAVIAHASGLEP